MNDDFDHIGAILKTARQAAGLSLDDVHFRTRLPKSALVSLEAGNFSEFPSPVYAKSFLSQYSTFLNVEAYQWLDELEPGNFAAISPLVPVLNTKVSTAEAKAIPASGQSGWTSIFALLALSTGLVVATVKGYEFFESRFASEKDPLPAMSDTPPSDTPKKAPTRKTSIQKEDDELAKPAPRAIIVR